MLTGAGYSVESTPHCLRRDFSLPIITSALSDEVIERTLSAGTFTEFNVHIQGYSMQVSGMTLHAGLHLGIGGAVGDVRLNPNPHFVRFDNQADSNYRG